MCTMLILCSTMLLSCAKEYSCEGCRSIITDPGAPPVVAPGDTIITIDTTKIDTTIKFPTCVGCDSTQPLALNTWTLKSNGSFTCGTMEYRSFNTDNSSVDFSGPLKCSQDTIFRIVAFFDPIDFNADRFNVSTTLQSLLFQDKINYMNAWNGMVFRTDFSTTPQRTIKVTIDTFYQATRLMIGHYGGYAYIRNTGKTWVEGKFRFEVQ